MVLDMFLPNRQCLCHSYVILVFFIYPIIYNLVSSHFLHKHTLSMPSGCCLHMYPSFACHRYHFSYTLLSTIESPHIVYTHVYCQCHLYTVQKCICYVHVISTAVICICTCHLHTVWAYMYYVHIICSGPRYVSS